MRLGYSVLIYAVAGFVSVSTLSAQSPRSQSSATVAQLVGSWTGTASIPFGDSTITVPVTYNFVASGSSVSGTAMVPGQGTGKISNVSRKGSEIRFRVTVTAATVAAAGANVSGDRHLDHEGVIDADGKIEGRVNMDSKPLALFKIVQRK